MSMRPPGSPKAFTPEAVLQTVKIDAERGRVMLVWCGAVRLLAPIADESLSDVKLHVG